MGPELWDLLSKDPIQVTTRKHRRSLLGVSLAGIVMTKGGLLPTKFAAIGLEFSNIDTQNLAFLMASCIAYFFITFHVYAFDDIGSARMLQKVLRDRAYEEEKETGARGLMEGIQKKRISFLVRTLILDFMFPTVTAIISFGFLINFAPPIPQEIAFPPM